MWCRCAVLSAMFLSRESAILFYIKMGLIENMMGAPDYGMSEHICMLEHHIIGFVRKYSALNAYGLELFEASFCHLNCRLRCPVFWTPLFFSNQLGRKRTRCSHIRACLPNSAGCLLHLKCCVLERHFFGKCARQYIRIYIYRVLTN